MIIVAGGYRSSKTGREDDHQHPTSTTYSLPPRSVPQLYEKYVIKLRCCQPLRYPERIRDFLDHATFKENGAKLACVDKLEVFLSLTLCKRTNFKYLSFIK